MVYTKKDIIKAGLLLVVGVFIGWILFGRGDNNGGGNISSKEEQVADNVVWTCSMHPQIRQDKPGSCPLCGMDLIPAESGDSEEALPGELQMTEAAIALAEVQTSIVKFEKPEKDVYLLGKVKPDERLIYSQTTHIPGRIEKLYINFTGEKVQKGQKLASIYSPELLTAQKELFEVLKDAESNPYLVKAARGKLKLWKFTDEQINALEERGELQTEIDILADHNGYVFMRHVSLGDHVMEGQSLFRIIDLTKVWIMFEAYESDLPWVKLGDKVEIEIQSIPGKLFKGAVTYIDPFINPLTRVANVRVELQNNGTKLKPDMFANGIIKSRLPVTDSVLLIPKSAVLWTGKRAVVYVKVAERKKPTFAYKEIVLGEDAGDSYIVAEGLEAGEEIAINGVFRIDAAAQLAGKRSMMNPDGGKVSTGHNHGGTDMGKNDNEGHTAHDMQSSLKIDKNTISTTFKKQLGEVVNSYLELKNALVNDDHVKAREAGAKIKLSLSSVDMKLLKGDAHIAWMEVVQLLNNSLDKLEGQDDIDGQRQAFSTISDALSESAKLLGVDISGTLYLQFCPMANDNAGGFWLSEQEEIHNPYFGEKMLKCGSTKEIIEQ